MPLNLNMCFNTTPYYFNFIYQEFYVTLHAWFTLPLLKKGFIGDAVQMEPSICPDSKDPGILIWHRSDTKASDRCLIDVDPKVFAIWVVIAIFPLILIRNIL